LGDFDIEEALGGLDVDEVRPIFDLIEQIGLSASEDGGTSGRRFPRKFGRFRVDRQLGIGGFGIVFEAYDPTLDRQVALKLPRLEVIATPAMVDRFYAEARASAGLSHPNVVHVHEAGEYGPTCFIVSELCAGPNLKEWLAARQEPVPSMVAAKFVLALADAVSYAQQAGVLHRDIKPSNILLDKPPREFDVTTDSFASSMGMIPKLTDFGLAKMLEEDTSHTPAGSVIGTPEYMAPEQAEGRLADITEATDVYGLGTVLYELLVGEAAFAGRTSTDKLRRVLLEDPTEPRRRRRDIPRDLEAIVLRCLKKDFRERYADAGELADDLRRFIAGRTTVARPLRPGQRLCKWSARHPSESILAGVVVSFLALAGFWGWLHEKQVRQAEQQTELARQQAELNEESAQREHRQLLQMEYAADLRAARSSIDVGDLSQATAILGRQLKGALSEDRLSFAWRLLWQLCHQWDEEFSIHSDDAYGIDFSPDGRWLASGGAEGKLALTDLRSSTTRMLSPSHKGELNELEFSADGRWLVSCSDEGTLHVRNGEGEWIRTIDAGEVRLFVVRLHPTRPLALTGDSERKISLWNIETGELAGAWVTESRSVDAVAFTADGRGVLAGDSDGGVWCVDDFEAGQPRLLTRLAGGVMGMFGVRDSGGSPGPGRVIVGGRNRQLTDIDVSSGRVIRQWPAHREWIQDLDVSADGSWFVSVSRDRTMKRWETSTGRQISRVLAGKERVWGVAISPDEKRLASSSADGTLKVWSLSRIGECPTLVRSPEPPVDLAAGPGDREVTVASVGGELTVLDVPGGRRVANWKVGEEITAIDVSARGVIAVAMTSGKVRVYSWLGEKQEARPLGEVPVVGPVALSMPSDGTKVVVSSIDGSVSVIRLTADGELSPPQRLPSIYSEDQWTKVGFSPDGKVIVTAAFDTTLAFWEAENLQWLRTLHRPYSVSAFAFDPTSAFLATVASDPVTAIESVHYGTRVATLVTGEDSGESVCYSRDGKNLMIGLADGTVRYWDVELPQELFREKTPLQEVSQLVMLRGGEAMVMGGKDRVSGEGLVLIRPTRGWPTESSPKGEVAEGLLLPAGQ
jgi:WD40 repeat protein